MTIKETTVNLALQLFARELFAAAVRDADAGRKVREVVRLEDKQLHVAGSDYYLQALTGIYVVAIGKAAHAMAQATTDVLKGRLTAGVVSAPRTDVSLSGNWQVFAGGHPMPNAASFAAAHAAIKLLRAADDERALVIFLISGGGSAMMELPRDERLTLEDVQLMNRVLVGCGAPIADINVVRRAISAIKGGGLSRFAAHAAQVTLIVSDTNPGDERNVASSPTIKNSDDKPRLEEVIHRYDLQRQLPASVMLVLDEAINFSHHDVETAQQATNHSYYTLLTNHDAVVAAHQAASERGLVVETIDDLVENEIAEGCASLVARLRDLRRRTPNEKVVCLISGGEFACRVRGSGIGGRNAEAALRCAMLFDEIRLEPDDTDNPLIALHAGTDGIDGNSPAAGAIADTTTLKRARGLGMNAQDYLQRSDAYTFFKQLGDDITTGASGTNVRDLRILIAA